MPRVCERASCVWRRSDFKGRRALPRHRFSLHWLRTVHLPPRMPAGCRELVARRRTFCTARRDADRARLSKRCRWVLRRRTRRRRRSPRGEPALALCGADVDHTRGALRATQSRNKGQPVRPQTRPGSASPPLQGPAHPANARRGTNLRAVSRQPPPRSGISSQGRPLASVWLPERTSPLRPPGFACGYGAARKTERRFRQPRTARRRSIADSARTVTRSATRRLAGRARSQAAPDRYCLEAAARVTAGLAAPLIRAVRTNPGEPA